MIAKIIAWSARNLVLVFFATAFAAAAGVYAVKTLPLDAIPDLSDVQVIVFTDYPGQAPQVVEDQVTYPLTTAMLTVPQSKVVRGFSFFGVSFVYVIFEDGTDPYWARSRVLEYLNAAASRLPDRTRFAGSSGSFSVVSGGAPTEHLHLAFPSASNAAVDAFHAAATAAGYRDNGAPGERAVYHAGYYGAFVLDPDGTNVEFVCHNRA